LRIPALTASSASTFCVFFFVCVERSEAKLVSAGVLLAGRKLIMQPGICPIFRRRYQGLLFFFRNVRSEKIFPFCYLLTMVAFLSLLYSAALRLYCPPRGVNLRFTFIHLAWQALIKSSRFDCQRLIKCPYCGTFAYTT